MANKKVLNATSTTIDNITFKSKFEGSVYKALLSSGLNFSYEPKKIILQEGFYPTRLFMSPNKAHELVKTMKKVLPITYTPDFVVNHNGITHYIEAKGMKTDSYNIKIKLFREYVEHQPNTCIYEVHTLRQLNTAINQIKQSC